MATSATSARLAILTATIEEFVSTDSWEQYAERLDFFFEARGIMDETIKRAALLSGCGKSTYALIRSLSMPKTPSELSYQDIVTRVKEHFTPRPSEIVQRFRFNKRDQAANESVATFVADLRRLSEHCVFGESLDLMLRDRLVCGLHDEAVQRRLLAEPELTFQKALAMATAAETAMRDATVLRVPPTMQGQVCHTAPKGNTTWQPKKGKQKPYKNVPRHPCFRCGAAHSPDECHYAETHCRYCKKKGHLERVCMSKARDAKDSGKTTTTTKASKAHVIEQDPASPGEGSPPNEYALNILVPKQVPTAVPERFMLTVRINGVPQLFEVDSGAACTIISEATYSEIWPDKAPPLEIDPVVLRTWTKERLHTLGTVTADVEYNGNHYSLPLLVIKGTGTSLLGRNWFPALGIHILGIRTTTCSRQTEDNIDPESASSTVFKNELGKYQGPPVSVRVDPKQKPIFLKSRPVPYALREKVEQEIDRLVQLGVLEPVDHAEWATPVVPVVKRDGSIRLCGDYRSTVNKCILVDTYPLPTTTDLLATLAGGKKFTKLDLSEAYLQLPVDDESAKLLTINTTKGLFLVKRLPFGITSAPSIFQRVMDTVLAGIQGVGAYLDDLLVAAEDDSQLQKREHDTLQAIEKAGLRLKKEKCDFGLHQVEYLGFRIDAEGVHPTTQKVAAIRDAPAPTNKEELQAFLGLLNFYSCFLPGKASVLEPLHRLLDKDVPWTWSTQHQRSFQEAKLLLNADTVLVHYDPSLPLTLACDASSYGLGAVLSHRVDGCERPVAFASRTLSRAERNYSQIQKEALAIVFGVRKFHNYLYGRPFTIYTDHKPLLGILNPTRAMPDVMPPQMLRWSLLLSSYAYALEFRPGRKLGNADALSRLPVPGEVSDPPLPGEIQMLEGDSEIIVASKIGNLTKTDPVLSRVKLWILHGFPEDKQEEQFTPYISRRNELSTHKDCILWGARVVIPGTARKDVLQLLHNGHPGIVRMKAIARSHVWWPGLDRDIETCVRECEPCQLTRNNPTKTPVFNWENPGKPWSRLHIDFAGPYKGQTFLLVVDAYSKWLEVLPVSSTTTQMVICKLRSLFATHGIPEVIVSDNATTFTSREFTDFLERNGIRATRSAPYHPATNGQVERYVQTTKATLSKIVEGDWNTRIARFLILQHTTPSTSTDKSPAELLMGRRLRTALDRLNPVLNETSGSEFRPPKRIFPEGATVYARNYVTGAAAWVPAQVLSRTGPLSYVVLTTDGQQWRRHVDQLRARHVPMSAPEGTQNIPQLPDLPLHEEEWPFADPPIPDPVPEPRQLRSSSRVRNVPLRYGDYRVHHTMGGGVLCTVNENRQARGLRAIKTDNQKN